MKSNSSILQEAFAELSRRRVFRVTAAYAFVAWLIVEMSSVVFPALLFPSWALRTVIYAALGGLPAAVILAWVFDITPAGVVVTKDDDTAPPDEVRKATRMLEGFIVSAIVVIVGMIGYLHFTSRTSTEDAPPSIAVLPFANLSGDLENEYFSDGVAEEILNALVKLEGLQVAARTSSFAFKGTTQNIRDIGEALNVTHVLEGSVRKSGDRLRITVQLIKVDDGFHVWSENYERTMDDVFAIQDEISMSIVDALKVQLIGQKDKNLVIAATESGEAYNLYLLGRYQWNKRTPQTLTRAIELFEQAIEIDPGFALAYSGLADSYLLLNSYGNLSFKAAKLKAQPAIATALKLDKTIAEPYASLGLLHMVEFDYGRAEPLLRAAIDLNPNYAVAHQWLGLVLLQKDGPVAANAEFVRALELDPLNPSTIQNLADSLAAQGRHDESIPYWDKLFRTHDGRLSPYYLVAILNAQESGALQHMKRLGGEVIAREPRDPLAIGAHAFSRLVLGIDVAAQITTIHDTWQESKNELRISNLMNLAYTFAGRQEQIIGDHRLRFEAMNERELNSDPGFFLGLAWSGAAASQLGKHEMAREYLEPFEANSAIRNIMDPSDRWLFLSYLAWAYLKLDMPGNGNQLIETGLREIDDSITRGWNSPRTHAVRGVLLAMQGNRLGAMTALKDAYDRGWVDLFWLKSDKRFDALRDYSTFREIVRGVEQRIESAAR